MWKSRRRKRSDLVQGEDITGEGVHPKVALVTGANRGLGREVVRQLSSHGIRVILSSRDEEMGIRASEELRSEGFENDFIPLDITSQKSVQNAFSKVLSTYGRLDILVNNAGVGIDKGRNVLEIDIDTFQRTIDVNLYGALRTCQAFIPLMLENDYGRIVNVSSSMGQMASMGSDSPSYRTSKAALNALTLIFASQLEGTNIKINACCPGWIKTDMGGPSAPRSVSAGAETVVWLALLPDDGPSGKFFADKQVIPW